MSGRAEVQRRSYETRPPRLATATLAGLAALVVTAALTYLTIELPGWLATLAENWVRIPGYDRWIEPYESLQFKEVGRHSWEAVIRFIDANQLYLIGYICVALAGAAVVGGLILGRRRLATAGAIALFIPVLGSFAGSMVFLVGIGILRVIWLPGWGTAVMDLGDISYLPYMAVVWPAWTAGLDVRTAVAYAAIGTGLLIFAVATTAWLLARLERRHLAEGGIYRFSRHPQYLGWIVWSWGMTLLSALQPMPYGGRNPGGGLAWLIMSMVIVAVAWHEENRMLESSGPDYAPYRARTPFLLPLPRVAARFVAAPLRLVARDGQPRGGRQILLAVVLYLGLFAVLSLPFALLDWPPRDWWAWPAIQLGT